MSESPAYWREIPEGSTPEHIRALLAQLGRQAPASGWHTGPTRTILRFRSVPAGDPVWEDPALGEPIQIPAHVAPSASFALVVAGDSLLDVQIQDGDELLIEATSEVRLGDLVIAWIPGQGATVKFLRRERDGFWLAPANAAYEPIRVTTETRFHGRVVAVLRRFRELDGVAGLGHDRRGTA